MEFEGNLLTRKENKAAEAEYEKKGLPVYNLEVSAVVLSVITNNIPVVEANLPFVCHF